MIYSKAIKDDVKLKADVVSVEAMKLHEELKLFKMMKKSSMREWKQNNDIFTGQSSCCFVKNVKAHSSKCSVFSCT